MDDPARVLIAGDTHGDIDWLGWLAKTAAANHCDGILQLGDLGMWTDRHIYTYLGQLAPNERWMTELANRCTRHGIWLRYIDGNHDNHPGYRKRYRADPATGIRTIRPGIIDWADRGAIWTWHGIRFAALGGSISLDRSLRDEGRNQWTRTEPTTRRQLGTLTRRLNGQPVDILITHDAPILPPGIHPIPETDRDPTLHIDTARNVEIINEAVQQLQPKLVIHGHYHLRWTGEHAGARIEGLASNLESTRRHHSWAVLQLDDTGWTWLDPT